MSQIKKEDKKRQRSKKQRIALLKLLLALNKSQKSLVINNIHTKHIIIN
jgi:hypothetical protein